MRLSRGSESFAHTIALPTSFPLSEHIRTRPAPSSPFCSLLTNNLLAMLEQLLFHNSRKKINRSDGLKREQSPGKPPTRTPLSPVKTSCLLLNPTPVGPSGSGGQRLSSFTPTTTRSWDLSHRWPRSSPVAAVPPHSWNLPKSLSPGLAPEMLPAKQPCHRTGAPSEYRPLMTEILVGEGQHLA